MLIRKNARHATAELDSARMQPVALSASRTRNEFKANENDESLTMHSASALTENWQAYRV